MLYRFIMHNTRTIVTIVFEPVNGINKSRTRLGIAYQDKMFGQFTLVNEVVGVFPDDVFEILHTVKFRQIIDIEKSLDKKKIVNKIISSKSFIKGLPERIKENMEGKL